MLECPRLGSIFEMLKRTSIVKNNWKMPNNQNPAGIADKCYLWTYIKHIRMLHNSQFATTNSVKCRRVQLNHGKTYCKTTLRQMLRCAQTTNATCVERLSDMLNNPHCPPCVFNPHGLPWKSSRSSLRCMSIPNHICIMCVRRTSVKLWFINIDPVRDTSANNSLLKPTRTEQMLRNCNGNALLHLVSNELSPLISCKCYCFEFITGQQTVCREENIARCKQIMSGHTNPSSR